MHYYAFDNRYGVGMRDADDLSRIGYLHIFESRSDRDAWVDADVWDGNYRREAITAREALPYLVESACSITCEFPGEVRARGVDWMVGAIESYRTQNEYWEIEA